MLALETEALGAPRPTLERSERQLLLARGRADKTEQAWALCGIFLAYDTLEEDRAHEQAAITEGMRLAREIDNVPLLARFLVGHGQLKRQFGQLAESAKVFDEAIALAEQRGSRPALVRALNGKASAVNNQGETAAALALYFRAHRIAEEIGMGGYWNYVTSVNIGSTYSLLEGDDGSGAARGRQYLEQALRDIPDPHVAAKAITHNLLGLAYYRTGKTAAAVSHWSECVRLSQGVGRARCEVRLALLDRDEGRFDAARPRLERALSVFQASRNAFWQWMTQMARAEVAAFQGRRAESLEALGDAEGLTRKLGTAERTAKFHSKAAEIFTRLGEPGQALQHAKLLRPAEQSQAQSADVRRANELRVRFDVEQVERENETLRVRERGLQVERRVLALMLALGCALAAGAAYVAVSRQRRRRQLAEAANMAKSRLLAAATRQLQQPVRAINDDLQGLASLEASARVQTLLADARRCAAAIDGMFHALLDLSRLDAAAQPVHVERFALQPLLEGVLVQFEPQARAKGLVLKVHSCRSWVRSDPQLVQRILHNFVANAIRYTERGRVVVGCRQLERRVRLAVYDSGPGIPADKHEAIFEEFYQLPRAEGAGAKGLGLGLAIVKRLARLLGTPVVLQARLGGGSMFAIDLPRSVGDGSVKVRRLDASEDAGKRALLAAAGGGRHSEVLAGDS